MLRDKIKGDLRQHRMNAREDIKSKYAAGVLLTLLGELETLEKRGEIIDDIKVVALTKKYLECSSQNQLNAVTTEDFAKFGVEVIALNEYLPKQLGEEELATVIEFFLSGEPDANIGTVMKFLKEGYTGMYDGAMASKITRELIS